jgi:hypothetical protein
MNCITWIQKGLGCICQISGEKKFWDKLSVVEKHDLGRRCLAFLIEYYIGGNIHIPCGNIFICEVSYIHIYMCV